MRFRRRLLIALALLALGGLITAAAVLRKLAPPEPARLLPGADAFFYLNASWLHHTGEPLPLVPRSPDYEQFVHETGFEPERDLEEIAIAVHYPPPATTPGAQSAEPRFSTVMRGHVHSDRLSAYLGHMAQSQTEYRGVPIFTIPLENRTLRVAILGVDMVATSNVENPAVLQGIVDRSKKLASPFAGPLLLRTYYRQIPQLPLPSLAWCIVRTDTGLLGHSAPLQLINGSITPTVVLGSVRYLGKLHLETQAFTRTDDEAQQLAERWENALRMFAGGLSTSTSSYSEPNPDGSAPAAAPLPNPNDPNNSSGTLPLVRLLESRKIDRVGKRVTLSMTVPEGLLQSAFAHEDAPPHEPPAPAPAIQHPKTAPPPRPANPASPTSH